MNRYLMNTYARMPVAFVRGEGAWLFDEDGRRYLDAISGIGVCSLGHADPVLADAICDQARTLLHTANLGHIRLQEQLAEALCSVAGMDRAFITNTGAEAIECAIKIARRHGHERGIDKPAVLVVEGAFHGRTLAAISASAPGKLQHGFTPLVEGFERVPFNQPDAVRDALERNPQIVAVLVEPIQGEGGVRIPDAGYLTALRQICNQHSALLIFDEIQTGLCRTGRWFAHLHEPESTPDMITVAKALGNGVPVAACVARSPSAETLTPGSHGTTFGGSPLACRAALTVLGRMRELDLPERAGRLGALLIEHLREGLDGHPRVAGIRGRGLMIGIELVDPAADIRDRALATGLIVNVTSERVVRLLPPLIIDRDQALQIAETLIELIKT
ncbi:MAG: aspartate aminotransferase family protein [Xanthomonadaceae bacterium]|nr:aspartate aminotransferase family protein [Xanthomonadaceae bacterium]